MQNTILNISALVSDFREDTNKMYKVIGELEHLFRYGNVENEYGIDLEVSELEDYLKSYIEAMHVKICMVLEFYNLEKLYNQYLEEYNGFSKTEINYYSEVDVMDSPIYGMMNRYIRALGFIENSNNPTNTIQLQNVLKSDIDNKVDVNTQQSITNNTTDLVNILDRLKEINFLNEIKDKEYRLLVGELENSANETDASLLNKNLTKIKEFLATTGSDYIKDEIKNKIPIVLRMITEFFSG
ncbi:hypothetical protein [Lysinibacillus xylanilyticus]|uniref:Uncharacterized protein n=1 Tax=Lysinibacillus xylanilyticus TaxID=582475 RepID=A0ABV3VQA3_9BACI